MGGITGSSKNAASRLARFAAEVPAAIAKALAPRLDKRMQAMFETQSDPYGKPWAPLKASTIRRKKGNSVILRRVNELGPGTYVLYSGRQLVFTIGPSGQYANDGDPNREPRLLGPAYGIPATWRADLIQTQAEVAKRMAV